LSDAERVAGRAQPADLAWHQAVHQSAALLARQPQVMDPCVWTRLARFRPAHLHWPAELTQQLAAYRPTFPVMLAVPPDTALWTAIGHAHLQRHEGQSALLAFKQAEAATTEASLRHPLSLAQARALLLLEQKPLAIALLARLVGEKDETTVAAAKAMLAAIKLQDHSVEQALALLQQAVEQGPKTDWPGRAQAEADLGIAYLSLGMEVAGLRWLHSAQQRFAEQQDVPLLMQCLTNEATYFSHARKEAEADSVRQKLRQLERV
jgi:tetratricopeptide (TPR) repeat protein